MLADRSIRRAIAQHNLRIDTPLDFPLQVEQFQAASVDLRAGDTYAIGAGQFMIGYTIEYVHLDQMLVGQVHGKSSWARRGLQVHSAGLIDPGFHGQITLEFFNMSANAIVVDQGRRIAQICFDWMDDRPDRSYGLPELRSRYQGQTGATPAREWTGVGCPGCGTVLSAAEAGCSDVWHSANQSEARGVGW